VQAAVDPQLAHPRECAGRLLLAEEVEQLVAHARPGHRAERTRRHGLAGEPLRLGVEVEPEPRGVAHCAQQARGVVDEARRMEHAHTPRAQVRLAAVRVVERAAVRARQPDGHCVDREVAPREIVGERGELHVRQRARAGVALAPRARQVEDEPVVGADCRGAEALVRGGPPAEPRGQLPGRGQGVALERDVEVHRVRAEHQVAHGAADQVRGRQALERRQEPVHPGDRLDVHSRTGMPAARIRSFAWPTVYAP
jgi:hypothetical protein